MFLVGSFLASHSVWFHASLVRTAMATYPLETCDGPMNEAAHDALVSSLVTEKLAEPRIHVDAWKHLGLPHYGRRSTTIAERATAAVGGEPYENLVFRGKTHASQPKN